jgi:hypothetical protein
MIITAVEGMLTVWKILRKKRKKVKHALASAHSIYSAFLAIGALELLYVRLA